MRVPVQPFAEAVVTGQVAPFYPSGFVLVGAGLMFGGKLLLMKRRWFGLESASVEGRIMRLGGFASIIVGAGMAVVGLNQLVFFFP